MRTLCLRVEPATEPAQPEASLQISSHHLTLRYLGDHVHLVDEGSVNGTFLQGTRLAARCPAAPLIDRCWSRLPASSSWN